MYYAVYHGRETGIFDTWEECIVQVRGFPGAEYRKFKNRKLAELFVKYGNKYTNYLDGAELKSQPPPQIPKSPIWYAVHYGRVVGVYTSVDEYREQVDNWNGEVSKQFKNREHAELFVKFGYRYVDHIEKSDNDENIINIYTDGSFRPGGARIRTSTKSDEHCGYGIYIPKLEIEISQKLYCEKLTNNVAELSAFLALYIIINKTKQYKIYTDSTYCIKVLTTFGEKNEKMGWLSEGIPNYELVKTCYNLYKPLIRSGKIELVHIHGHGGSQNEHTQGNETADRLASGN